jgi:alkylation response protein AidB-like acyl-CoA dehydrogenase
MSGPALAFERTTALDDKVVDLSDRVRVLVKAELAPLAAAIDEGKTYPAEVLRHLGGIGAWSAHLPAEGSGNRVGGGTADLRAAITAMAAIGECCGATAFMAWCQDTLAWYVANSDNAALKARLLDRVASGAQLGGTGLSNPMKSFFGIETLKLKGRKVDGGYRVEGSLPWVSNLGPDHLFGTIFALEDMPGQTVMFIADCASEGIKLQACPPFLAMDGTGTFAVHFRDAFVPDELILAAPAQPFVKKIRAGFILLQTGMALGLIRDCIAIMKGLRGSLGHINDYLDQQPEDYETLLDTEEREVMALAATPYDTSDAYWERVVSLRLRLGEASVAAANAAMLHCGARGYLTGHRAQRRLREAYFVAIVTPATKQLKKMLSDHKQDLESRKRPNDAVA